MKTLHKYVAFVFLMLFVGCSQVGLTAPASFEDKLAYAVGVHTAVQIAAAQSLNAHAITSDDAKQVLKMADDSRLILDAARQASGMGDMTTANAKLILATTALTALQTYLTDRSKKNG